MNAIDILSGEEIQAVLEDLNTRLLRSVNSWQNLVIFRLSCCCGLRAKEICGLNLRDVIAGGSMPAITIRQGITKGKDGCRKARSIPLWWDKGTRKDIAKWFHHRIAETNGDLDQPFVCSQSSGSNGKRLTEDLVAKRWRTAIRILSDDRVRQLHLHCGRHTFCSHSLAAGHSLVAVRDAAGHANIATTNIYLHYCERKELPDTFSYKPDSFKTKKKEK